jgi:hypothetical protein
MTEGLFLLTTLFVAYVIYTIVNEKKTAAKKESKPVVEAAKNTQPAPKPVSDKPAAKATKPAETKPTTAPPKKAAPKAVAKAVEPVKTAVAPAPAPKKTVAKPVEVKKAEAVPAPVVATSAVKGTGLKDPKTGEVATTYSNYRFTKRWIKEALVTEKFLDKVYKNDELNANIETQIKSAIIKLEGMKKYKP